LLESVLNMEARGCESRRLLVWGQKTKKGNGNEHNEEIDIISQGHNLGAV